MASDGYIKDRFEFWAEGDETAKEHARQYVDGHDVEVWHSAQASSTSLNCFLNIVNLPTRRASPK